MKQRGAILAKGWLLGLQFRELLRDGLYLDLAHHANEMAKILSAGMTEKGYSFTETPQSNQLFPALPNDVIRQLRDAGYSFEVGQPVDPRRTCIRLVTSWATPRDAVDTFLRDLPAAR
jgi:threonine aldolase